jgi:serine/threonine protein phosphatase PrpC
VEIANQRIFAQSRDNQSERGMGTTCTVAALVDETLVVGQIGDSRCYVFREGRLAQVTKDQSLAWQLIEAGAMTPEEAKAFEHANIILQALGVQEHVEVVLSQVSLRRGDVILLCSDGLHGPVSDEEMLEILRAEPDLKKATENLLQKALERDGPDNVTVVLARFDGEGLKVPGAEDVVGFLGYDPGRDTEEELPPIVEGEIGAVPSAAAIPQQTEELPRSGPSAQGLSESGPFSGGVLAERRGRSLVGWFLLVLLAAAAGGVFVLRCEHDQADPPARSAGP